MTTKVHARSIDGENFTYVFDTVQDMIDYPDHEVGALLQTKGYYTAGDGGGASYLVQAGNTGDGYGSHDIGFNTAVLQLQFDLVIPRNFGVRSDNSSDDWGAWDACMKFYRTQVYPHSESGMTPSIQAPLMTSTAGRSLLSKPLSLYGYLHADFSKTQFARHSSWSASATDYLLTSSDMYIASIKGLNFYNTDYALEIQNANLDNGFIELENLCFSKCNNALRIACQSSTVHVKRSRFDNCERAINVERGDMVNFEGMNMWQGVLTTNYGCSIQIRNARVKFVDVIGVPAVHTGSQVAWVNNSDNGRVSFDNFRAGGEGTGGCALVNNFSKWRVGNEPDPTPCTIDVRNSQIYGLDRSGGLTACAIRLHEIPNAIWFENNSGLTEIDEVITWAPSITGETKVNELLANLSNFAFEYHGNCNLRGYPFHDSLKDLFLPSDTTPLRTETVTTGTTAHDTRLLSNDGVYEVVISGAPVTSESQYRCSWKGKIIVSTKFSAPDIVKYASVLEELSTTTGASNTDKLSVSATFISGSTVDPEPAINNDYRLRLVVTGWNTGAEGQSFDGTITQIL